jgi:hypothetical protein
LHGLFEDGAERLFVIAPETPQRVVIRLNQPGQPEQQKRFPAGHLQFARRANPVVVAVKPDFQEQAAAGAPHRIGPGRGAAAGPIESHPAAATAPTHQHAKNQLNPRPM